MTSRLTLALTALFLGMFAGPASAQDIQGGISLKLDAGAKRTLDRAQVKIVLTAPSSLRGANLTIPAKRASFARTPQARHEGVVQLRRGKRRVTLTSLRTEFGLRPATTALLGGRRVEFLTYGRALPSLDRKTRAVRLAGSAYLARPIAKKLGLRKLRRIGRVEFAISSRSELPVTPLPPGSQQPGSPNQTLGVPIVGGAMTWRPRESFINYMNADDGRITVSEGATEGPREGANNLIYSYGMPFVGGTDGSPAFGGRVTFTWESRTIDLHFREPIVTIAGAASNVSFVMSGATTPDAYRDQRVVALNLDLTRAAAQSNDGRTVTYERIPASLTEQGTQAFAGFYQPGEQFGSVSVTYTKAQ